MAMVEELSAGNKKAAVSQPVGEVAAAGGSTDAVKLPLDPNESYKAYAAMRAKGAIVNVAFSGGEGEVAPEMRGFFEGEHLFVSRYDAVLSSLLDPRISSDPHTTMTEEQREKLPPVVEEFKPFAQSLIALDPPDHTRLRRLLQPSFSVRMMAEMRPRIQKIADDLLDKAEREADERGEARPDRQMDLIAAFAYPLPVTVISDMLGIPVEDREQVKLWTENLLRTNNRRAGLDEATRAKMRQFTSYLRALFVAKRRRPADDVITQLLQAEEEGDKLTEDEVLSSVFILYLAGHVTTVNLVGNGTLAFMLHPDQLAKLKANPGLTKAAVEEVLRYWGPVDFLSTRVAKEGLELGGMQLPKGEPLMVGLASANRDPARFENPDAFDITRPDVDRHVAFGKGIHLCVGAPLARLEGQIAFETLFGRYPEMRLAVAPEEIRWGNAFLRGVPKLPLLF